MLVVRELVNEPLSDTGTLVRPFSELRRNFDSGEWRPVVVPPNNRNPSDTNHERSRSAAVESSVRSTSGSSPLPELFNTPSTTRRPLSSYTRLPRPAPRAFEIASDAHPTPPPRPTRPSFDTTPSRPHFSSPALPSSAAAPDLRFVPLHSAALASHLDHNRLSTVAFTPSSSPPFSTSSSATGLQSTSARPPPPSPAASSAALRYGAPSTTESPRSNPSNVVPVSLAVHVNVTIESSCFNCICEATSGCDQRARCRTNEFGEFVCGPFALNRFFWTEAGKPGDQGSANAFESCALDRSCAQHTIQSYVNRNPIDCNDDGAIDCLDFAALARLGKAACNLHSLLDSNYWTRFQQCYGFGDD
jgi:hypothetical protein